MITDVLSVEIKDSVEQAPKYGPEFTALKITTSIVVCKGTVAGKPTVDLQLEDSAGNKYLVMATGSILESLAAVITAKREQAEMEAVGVAVKH